MVVYSYKKGRQTMKNIITTIAMFILTFSTNAQTISNDKVIHYLDSFVGLYLNKQTIKDDVLAKAAKIQSDYMLKTGQITHFQENPIYRTPPLRVFEVDNNFIRGFVSEIAGGGSIPKFDKKFKCVEEQIAFNILNMIKGSPKHNSILIGMKFYGYSISFGQYDYFFVIDCV